MAGRGLPTILAKNPSPFPEDNNSSSGNWGNAPKVQGTVGSNIGSKQNATNPITPSSNWLGDPTSFGNQLSPQNFTRAPLFISRVSEPVHAIDASWNHTAQIPQPDPMVSYMGGMPKRMTQLGLHLIISKSRYGDHKSGESCAGGYTMLFITSRRDEQVVPRP